MGLITPSSRFEERFGVDLRPHQRAAMDLRLKQKYVRWARRCGSTFCAAAEALQYALDWKKDGDGRVLVLAPHSAHIENFFGRMREWLTANEDVGKMVMRNVRGSPQKIELKTQGGHYCSITGYATGSSATGTPLWACGQDAHKIIVDSAAYVPDSTYRDVICPILYTSRYASLSAYSTPSTKVGWFERGCASRGSLHITVHEGLDLDNDTLARVRNEYTDEVYWRSEALADLPPDTYKNLYR